MLRSESVISHIGVLETGQLEVRRSRRVYDGDDLIAEQYHRHVVAPGDDVTQEDMKVRLIASVLHTPNVIAAYRALQARNQTTGI